MSSIAWIIFFVVLIAMLAIDLFVLNRNPHEVKVKEALWQTLMWIVVSLLFCVGIYIFDGNGGLFTGGEKALEFLTGYLIEKALSMDNLFVFVMLFSAFAIPPKYQHEVLFWGIIGALVMRALFIFAGVALIAKFHWIIYVFGAFLIFSGIKMVFHKEEEQPDPEKNSIVKFCKKLFPVTSVLHGGKFFVRENGKRFATPLFITLIVIECTDLIFAVDSIPAVLAVSNDPFIVLTSNMFAILGLRALYFALAGITQYFVYLKYGLAIILSFVGVKMVIGGFGIHVSIGVSLAVIFGVILLSILGSVFFAKKKEVKINE